MWIDEHTFYLDERPMEIIPLEERKEKFKREIGPDIHRLTPEQIKTLREVYMLEED